jgi:hypothetical protein
MTEGVGFDQKTGSDFHEIICPLTMGVLFKWFNFNTLPKCNLLCRTVVRLQK